MGDRKVHPPARNQRIKKRNAAVDALKADRIAELWLQGYSQAKIVNEVRISLGRVQRVLRDAQKAWLERKNMVLADAIAEQLKRVDYIEAKAWEDYVRSKEDKTDTLTKICKAGMTRTVTVRQTTGDPRFLEVAMKCVDMRCKLLGIYKPPEERAEIMAWGVTVVVDTPEQADEILAYEQFQSMVVDGSAQPAIASQMEVIDDGSPEQTD